MNFCRRCGKPLVHKKDHVYVCPSGHTLFANHSPAVGVFFVSPDNKEVLLTVRGFEPHKGMLDTAGGFLDANENFEEGIARELKEELGLTPQDYGPLIYLASDYDIYNYKGEDIPFVSVLFWSRLTTDKKLKPADDVAAVNWHRLDAVEPEQLHANDIRTGISKIKKAIEDGELA